MADPPGRHGAGVLPTYAGMVRRVAHRWCGRARAPYARGGGPPRTRSPTAAERRSCTREWSVEKRWV
ncbi:hypothetical protein D7D52_36100 [Nocardia yunnanensis]|uniref:Uncharacterized protein n=1 Tax=Nocardia yunnanensis TaxID=2382165 RepID=A0A386ZNT2_9NOCA|nr:hypothetical protein D7D52_36100 [Nocardia yunnanensis]